MGAKLRTTMAKAKQYLRVRQNSVAQICNLLYRRFLIGWAWKDQETPEILKAVRIENPRYGRLKICATHLACARGHLWRNDGMHKAACLLAMLLICASLRAADSSYDLIIRNGT